MKETKYKGKFLEITEEKIDGHIYERVKLRPGVKVIPINKENKILFIKEFRVYENETSIKLVSGGMDKVGKTPLEIAKEELREETSHEAKVGEEFHSMNTDNFTVENKIRYFLAKDVIKLDEKVINPDHDIVEEILGLSEKEFGEKVDSKEINGFSDNFVAAMVYRGLNKK